MENAIGTATLPLGAFAKFGMGNSAGMFWLHVHWFFGLLALVGFILLTVWALKSLSGEKLKSFVVWLLVVGIAGSLLTVPLSMEGRGWLLSRWGGMHGMGGMMEMRGMKGMHEMMEMMEECEEGEGSEECGEMMEMMRGMMQE
jgi:hypothetical protein